jgi:hypothetical protein
MNIAIILAVSKYKIPGNDLPASAKDGEIINSILTSSGKYDHILYLKDNQTSIEVKDLLDEFFTKHKDQDINEFFFYYSGHGDFSNNKFHYMLSDYDDKKKNQTTIENEYFDDLIRSLGPELVVKVVDACQSGARYIKDFDILPKYFNESKIGFKNCYFMFSSLSNQYSYQDDNLSFFTKSFIEAIKVHTKNEISFKHIIEFITDEFENIGEQTPFYVIQAQMTEKFLKYNDALKEYLANVNLAYDEVEEKEKKKISILDIVKNNAKEYVDRDGAINALNFCAIQFEKLKLDKEIDELFDLEVVLSSQHNDMAGALAIGRWLENNNHDLFAKTTYDNAWYANPEDPTVTGYSFLLDNSPYTCLTVKIQNKYPNLKSYACHVAVLVSKREIYFFYSLLTFVITGWDENELDSRDIKLKYSNAKIADESSIKGHIQHIYNTISKNIKGDIESQFGLDLNNL